MTRTEEKNNLLEVELVCILRSLSPGVGDVSGDVEPLRNRHGMGRTHPKARAGDPHQLHGVQGDWLLLLLPLGGHT